MHALGMRLTSQTSYLIKCVETAHTYPRATAWSRIYWKENTILWSVTWYFWFWMLTTFQSYALSLAHYLFMHAVEYAGGCVPCYSATYQVSQKFLQFLCLFVRFSSRCILELTITEQQKSVLTGSRFHYVVDILSLCRQTGKSRVMASYGFITWRHLGQPKAIRSSFKPGHCAYTVHIQMHVQFYGQDAYWICVHPSPISRWLI